MATQTVTKLQAEAALLKVARAHALLKLIDFCDLNTESNDTLADERRDALGLVFDLLDDAYIPLDNAVSGLPA